MANASAISEKSINIYLKHYKLFKTLTFEIDQTTMKLQII
jgi:hypothetical protein